MIRSNTSLGVDYYKNNPPAKPKEFFGDTVEHTLGLSVPKRLSTFEEAYESEQPFLARSEHPQDLSGLSDLQDTLELVPARQPVYQDTEDDRASLIDSNIHNRAGVDLPAQLLGISPEEYRAQCDFSLWSVVDGFNRTVFPDRGVPGQYYVATVGDSISRELAESVTINGGHEHDLVLGYMSELVRVQPSGNYELVAGDAMSGVIDDFPEPQEAVDLYRSVHGLDGLGGEQHAAIIEMQAKIRDDITHDFLQYHYGADIEPATFELDMADVQADNVADMVVGATGINEYSGPVLILGSLLRDGLNGVNPGPCMREYLYRYGNIPVVKCTFDTKGWLEMAVRGHESISMLTKPPLSLLYNEQKINEIGLFDRAYVHDFGRGVLANVVDVTVVSDGKNAVIEAL